MVQQVFAEALGKYSEPFESSADGNVVRLDQLGCNALHGKWVRWACGRPNFKAIIRTLPSALAPRGSAESFIPLLHVKCRRAENPGAPHLRQFERAQLRVSASLTSVPAWLNPEHCPTDDVSEETPDDNASTHKACVAAPYSDGACSFITSRASAECAIAAPARISAATQMASMISFSVAPF